MLANDLAKAIADLWAAVISISWLGRQFLRFPRRRSRFGKRSDLLDRADTDAIGLPQCTVDGARLSDPHFGAPKQSGDIGRVGISVTDETFAVRGFVDRSFECPSRNSGL